VIGDYIGGLAGSLEHATVLVGATTFDTPDVLFGLINAGAYFTGGKDVTDGGYDYVSSKLQEMIYASALPMAWATGNTYMAPFIATGSGVATPGASGCDGYYPGPANSASIFTDDQTIVYTPSDQDDDNFYQSVFFCVNNAPYWLMTAHTSSEYKGIYVEQPTNLASLNGSSWGGLTGQNVATAAINSWIRNGNVNTNTPASTADLDDLQALADGDITRIPGLVQIPVCTFKQASDTATADKTNTAGNPYWPCPASGTTG
jgi:hypothetical protein